MAEEETVTCERTYKVPPFASGSGLKLKNYFYEDFDGTHFPDAYVGSVEWHHLDFSECLNETPMTTLDKAYWYLGRGITSFGQKITGHVASTKLALLHPGSYEITCKAYVSNEHGQQTLVRKLIVKVY